MNAHDEEWRLEPAPNVPAGDVDELGAKRRAKREKPEFLANIDPASLPEATHQGNVDVGGVLIPCAVLSNGQRVLTQQGFLRAIGRARSAKGGQGATGENLPAFLAAKNLEPFISDHLRKMCSPVIYVPLEGGYFGIAFGYPCELLPAVCQVYVDAYHERVPVPGGGIAKNGVLRENQYPIYKQCDILLRGLQVVGIAALVDEATGFQADRTRDAMQEILRQFISEELVRWAKTFPDEYYKELFRLRGIQQSEFTNRRPKYFGHLTNDIIYARLAPNVLEELRRLTPKDAKGRKKHKLFQRLTEHIGHPKLQEHLSNVITLMKASPNDKVFMRLLNRAKPRYKDVMAGQTSMDLDIEDDADSWLE